jgi:phosphatidate cytidylyltransferase
MMGLWEFYGLAEKTGAKPNKTLGIILGIVTYSVVIPYHFPVDVPFHKIALIALPLVVIIAIAELYRKKDNPFTNIAYTIFGVVYVVLPFALFNFFVSDLITYEYHFALGFFCMVWANDTGAYLSGKAFGKHKLFERISPNKTWQGSVGGVILTIGVAVLFSWIWDNNFDGLVHWLVVAVIIGVVGGLGDLVESMFKRSIDVKDSGNIMPGHGGILDRFDAVLLAAPCVFAYIMLVR